MLRVKRNRCFAPACFFAIAYAGFAADAHAGVSDQVQFKFAPTAHGQIIENGKGFTKLLVASNSPFSVYIENAIGDVNVQLQKSGHIGDTRFGERASLSGLSGSCKFLTSFLATPIFHSEIKTAMYRGSVVQQSVQLTVKYDTNAMPTIWVKPTNSFADETNVNSTDCAQAKTT